MIDLGNVRALVSLTSLMKKTVNNSSLLQSDERRKKGVLEVKKRTTEVCEKYFRSEEIEVHCNSGRKTLTPTSVPSIFARKTGKESRKPSQNRLFSFSTSTPRKHVQTVPDLPDSDTSGIADLGEITNRA